MDLFLGELTILATNESSLPATDPFVLELAFATPLLNDGPTEVDLVFASLGTCSGEVVEGVFCDNDTAGGFGVTGDGNNVTLVGSVSQVPVPAALPLMLAGLAGLGLFARRRKTT